MVSCTRGGGPHHMQLAGHIPQDKSLRFPSTPPGLSFQPGDLSGSGRKGEVPSHSPPPHTLLKHGGGEQAAVSSRLCLSLLYEVLLLMATAAQDEPMKNRHTAVQRRKRLCVWLSGLCPHLPLPRRPDCLPFCEFLAERN